MQACEPYNVVNTKPPGDDGVYDVPEQEASYYESVIN